MLAAQALHEAIVGFAAGHFGAGAWRLDADGVTNGPRKVTLRELSAAARSAGIEFTGTGDSNGSPRSVAFNVQGFRVAVNPRTGEIRILKSVQAADAGVVINPMQCRGQIQGAVAQSLGAAMFEELVIDANGRVVNPSFRDYHVPAFPDVPFTEVYFADTRDPIGPYGAKSMSEAPTIRSPPRSAMRSATRPASASARPRSGPTGCICGLWKRLRKPAAVRHSDRCMRFAWRFAACPGCAISRTSLLCFNDLSKAAPHRSRLNPETAFDRDRRRNPPCPPVRIAKPG